MKLCKKRAQSPNFPFSSVLFGDFVTKNRYFFVTIHSVELNFNFGALFRQNKAPERHLTPFLDQLDALHYGSIALRISEISTSKDLDFAQL